MATSFAYCPNDTALLIISLIACRFLQNNNTLVKFATKTPQFIPLPYDQQIKLRTFANKTNISFLTEVEGSIKAQVPKSIGATVNTHTEQIDNLNKELDRVKKLEESTVSTVETESNYTVVEQTSNGYFEDVKLEGKTLVNKVKQGAVWQKYGTTGELTVNNGVYRLEKVVDNNSVCYMALKIDKVIQPNTKYTIVLPNFIISAALTSLGRISLYDRSIGVSLCTLTEIKKDVNVYTILILLYLVLYLTSACASGYFLSNLSCNFIANSFVALPAIDATPSTSIAARPAITPITSSAITTSP